MLELAIRRRLGAMELDAEVAAPNGVTAIFGPSGSGKTSLINAVAGLLRPDAGRIAAGGHVLFDSARRIDLPARARGVGYVFQDARLFPHMSVAKNLAYGGEVEADRVIDLLGLRPLLDRRPAGLSGGEKQRVALGRALMRGPDVLLMDEPLAALDAPRKAEIIPYLEALRDRRDLPILYVTHDLREVARLADRVVVMDRGRVRACGDVAEVLSDPDLVPFFGAAEAGAVISARVAGIRKAEGLTELAFDGGRLLVPGRLGRIGDPARVRIPAQDVILSRTAPEGLSALNILPVTVEALSTDASGIVAVRLRAGRARLLSEVTASSAARLALAPGQDLHAVVKAVAMAAG